MAWSLGPDKKQLVWTGGGAAPMLSGKEQKAQRKTLSKGAASAIPLQSGNRKAASGGKNILTGGIHPSGANPAQEGGYPDLFGTEADIMPGAKSFDTPGGRTIQNPNGVSFFIPGAAAAAEHGGGGGGGGDNLPNLQDDLKAPAPQEIPFPQQAQASSLGAPNQTWDWLLETLAAPGLLSPSLNLLGTYLAQNSTANNAGYSPMITQQNFGGLFGSPTSPPPFLSQPPAPFIGQTIADAQKQSYTGLPLQQVSGGVHPGNLMSGGGTINPLAVGPGGSFSASAYPPMVGGGLSGLGLLGNTQAGGASSRK